MQWRGVSILQEKWCRASWASGKTVGRAKLGTSLASPRPRGLPTRSTRPSLLSVRGLTHPLPAQGFSSERIRKRKECRQENLVI